MILKRLGYIQITFYRHEVFFKIENDLQLFLLSIYTFSFQVFFVFSLSKLYCFKRSSYWPTCLSHYFSTDIITSYWSCATIVLHAINISSPSIRMKRHLSCMLKTPQTTVNYLINRTTRLLTLVCKILYPKAKRGELSYHERIYVLF